MTITLKSRSGDFVVLSETFLGHFSDCDSEFVCQCIGRHVNHISVLNYTLHCCNGLLPSSYQTKGVGKELQAVVVQAKSEKKYNKSAILLISTTTAEGTERIGCAQGSEIFLKRDISTRALTKSH
jgi:hypothetical protein